MEDPFEATTDEPTKAIGFCRASNKNVTQAHRAIQAQKQKIAKAAANADHEVVAYFEQVGSTRCSCGDTALQEAREYCMENPSVSCVIAITPYHVARSLSGYRYWEDVFYGLGVHLHFIDVDERDYDQTIANLAVKEFNARSQAAQKKRNEKS